MSEIKKGIIILVRKEETLEFQIKRLVDFIEGAKVAIDTLNRNIRQVTEKQRKLLITFQEAKIKIKEG